MWGAVAGWLASRTIDPRVVSSNPGRSVTCGCVPGQNTLPLIARVFSDRTLKIVGPFYQGPYAWSCPNGLRLVFTAKLSLSQFSGIHESEKRSPNALGRPTAKSANYQA